MNKFTIFFALIKTQIPVSPLILLPQINFITFSGNPTFKYASEYISEFQKFILKFSDSHPDLIKEILARIKLIAVHQGLQSTFFRRESKYSNNIFRLMNTKDLRLFCIIFQNSLLMFGSGRAKIHNTAKLQQNPQLSSIVNDLIKIENSILNHINSGTLAISDGFFSGKLDNLKL